jgi:hypothetical protein
MQRCGDKERSEEGVDREDAYLQQMQSRWGRGRGLRGCGGGRAAPHCSWPCSQQAFGRDGVVLVRTGLGVVLRLAIHRKNFELKRCGGVEWSWCVRMCACFASRGTKKRNGRGKGNIGSCDQLLECEIIFHKSSFCTSIKKKEITVL